MLKKYAQINVVIFNFAKLCLTLVFFPSFVLAQDVPVTVIIQFGDDFILGSSCVPRTTLCDPEISSRLMFNEIVLPRIKTRIEEQYTIRFSRPFQLDKNQQDLKLPGTSKSEEDDDRRLKLSKVFEAQLRYEHVDLSNQLLGQNLDGNLYSTILKARWDLEDFSFGLLVPYDFIELDRFDAHRIGTLAFGQYHLDLSDDLTLGLTVNGNYLYTTIDASDINDVNTLGGGISASLILDRDPLVLGAAASYQYHTDDSNRDNNEQHLIKIGTLAGWRPVDRASVTLFGNFNYDVTNYKNTLSEIDDTAFDLGLEVSWSLSPNWHLVGGYKKVLGLEDFDSDLVFVGTLLRF